MSSDYNIAGQAALLALLDGAQFATALRNNGRPGRVHLPEDVESRAALVDTHLRGAPASIEFHAEGHSPWRESVEAVVLATYSPGADGFCRWLGIDLDAGDHGTRGLADPVHAVRAALVVHNATDGDARLPAVGGPS
jgi:hypothetical protein